jgi:tRNA(Arg) A34 adenosine deaminase TadA
MWSDLPSLWQASCEDCPPIGAVVVGPEGEIRTRGRNRISAEKKPEGRNGAARALAEGEALRRLDLDAVDPHAGTLLTSTEPCPMRLRTFSISGLRALQFTARDPYAGSTNRLGTTWHLDHKAIQLVGPVNQTEIPFGVLLVEQELNHHAGRLTEEVFWGRYLEVLPEAIRAEYTLFQAEIVRALQDEHPPACQLFDQLTAAAAAGVEGDQP